MRPLKHRKCLNALKNADSFVLPPATLPGDLLHRLYVIKYTYYESRQRYECLTNDWTSTDDTNKPRISKNVNKENCVEPKISVNAVMQLRWPSLIPTSLSCMLLTYV